MSFKLDKNNKEAWLQALRSGKYSQGKGRLVVSHKTQVNGHYKQFCVLGVLKAEADIDCGDSNSFLPKNILPISIQSKLMQLNDIEGKSFDEIADFIEENL